jgi:hypothetical protein
MRILGRAHLCAGLLEGFRNIQPSAWTVIANRDTCAADWTSSHRVPNVVSGNGLGRHHIQHASAHAPLWRWQRRSRQLEYGPGQCRYVTAAVANDTAAHMRWIRHSPKREPRPDSQRGRGLGNPHVRVWGDCWRAPLGKRMSAPAVPPLPPTTRAASLIHSRTENP